MESPVPLARTIALGSLLCATVLSVSVKKNTTDRMSTLCDIDFTY